MKKGFTLIELLAVIVILAIISLIAIPALTKVVNNAKEQAALRSVEGHIENMNKEMALNISNNDYSDGVYTFNEFNFSNYKAKDTVKCDSYNVKNATITDASGCFVNKKRYCYTNYHGVVCTGDVALANKKLDRISEIRNTPNTDISKRTGKIYYVSNEGNDSNDGLSPERPFKTLDILKKMTENWQIKKGDTILFRDGDTFRGNIEIKAENILLGSYGDISKGKPKIYKSPYDGAKQGKWIEVKKNIWKYQVDGKDALTQDVGTIWFFCNKNNKSCTKSMDSIDRKFEYAWKVSTAISYDETDMESKIDNYLKEDLHFYHVGHSMNKTNNAKALYLYSVGDPSKRFDEIEFSTGGNAIHFAGVYSNLYIDNLNIAFTGSHGIGTGSISNLVVTNCEIGFIGGSAQNYNKGTITRYGNGVEIYGNVMPKNGSDVTDGFVVDNSYVYQCYDAGLTFQYTTNAVTRMDKVRYTNNVLEYSNYNIEYWNETSLTDQESIDNSYIKDVVFSGNIFNHSGRGLCETRHNQGQSAHIKTWNTASDRHNNLKGTFIIENNTFEDSREQYLYIRAPRGSLPTLRNNTFYGDEDSLLGFYFSEASPKNTYTFGEVYDRGLFNSNKFIVSNRKTFESKSGVSGDIKWNYDSNLKTLTITGTEMPDYKEGTAPWYGFRDGIKFIRLGDTITKLGNYAFYNLTKVNEISINSNIKDFSYDSSNVNNGTNYIFYKTGQNSLGINLIIGENVTYLPRMFTKPTSDSNDSPNITNVTFNKNKFTTLKNYALSRLRMEGIKVPEGVKSMVGLSLGHSKLLELIILPSTLENIGAWSMAGNDSLKKVVLTGGVNTVLADSFYGDANLTTLVIPSIKTPSTYNGKLFNAMKGTLTIYGDSSTKTFVDNIMADPSCTNKNIVFKDISEYKVNIKSSEGLNINKNFKDSYTFTTTKQVDAYYVTSGLKVASVDITRNGNTYTISNIVSDIYIDLK